MNIFMTDSKQMSSAHHEKGYIHKLEGRESIFSYACAYLRWMSKQDWKWRKMTIASLVELSWLCMHAMKNIKCKMHWEYHKYEIKVLVSINIFFAEIVVVIPTHWLKN
jgi:hypothetical protein